MLFHEVMADLDEATRESLSRAISAWVQDVYEQTQRDTKKAEQALAEARAERQTVSP